MLARPLEARGLTLPRIMDVKTMDKVFSGTGLATSLE
jgi:hypothetical protein